MKLKPLPLAATAMLLTLASPVAGQGLPTQEQSIALVSIFAERGEECGLLKRWQAETLRAQVEEASRRWDAETRARVIGMRDEKYAEIDCDSEVLNVWIEGASKGFESEYMPPYLVVYRTLARMEAPPAAFTAVALRLDFAPAIAEIDAHLKALEASGQTAEGGKSWPEFIQRTEAFAEQFAAQAKGEGEDGTERYAPDEAAGWLAQSALITELWLEDRLASDAAQ